MLESMFRSARVKLTVFYLIIIVLFSFAMSITIRIVAERELIHSNTVQRSEVREMVIRYFRLPNGRAATVFEDLQQSEAERVREHLNKALIGLNIIALTIGGFVSYWFAGRTLKPIEEAHAAQARFTADASHELRTPLTNMRLENEIFLRQKDFAEQEARDLISSNLEEIARLESLSSNLLALAQYGRVTLERQSVDAKTLIEKAIDHVRVSTDAKHMKIVADIEATPVEVHPDSVLQMLTIILDNAQKYGPANGVITMKGTRHGQHYIITVKDEGPGIDPADLPHIFDCLYRGDKARSSKVSGYGLGLALAHEIAQANKATITAVNAPGGGAVFGITLEAPTRKT
jgi:two-component system sensor histidine kinase CiaH